MKNLIVLIMLVAGILVYFDVIGPGANFVVPEVVAPGRTGSAIETYEFTELFDQNRPTSALAKKGYYTVVEGYIDTCSICKRLEADFTPFLRQRPDVVIRRLHFPEDGVSQSFTGNTQQEMNRQIADYYARLGKYNFNHIVKTETEYRLSTCGTPHIEIYGPDRQLIAADKCAEKNNKAGLAFIRKWIKAEQS